MQAANLYFFDKFGENYNFRPKTGGVLSVYSVQGSAPTLTQVPSTFILTTTTSGDGSGATFNISYSTGWKVEVVNPGQGYTMGDTITIAQSSIPSYIGATGNITFNVGNYWYGREWIKPISVGLFDSRQIFIVENKGLNIQLTATYTKYLSNITNVLVQSFVTGTNQIVLSSPNPNITIGSLITGISVTPVDSNYIIEKSVETLTIAGTTTAPGGGATPLTFTPPSYQLTLSAIDSRLIPGAQVSGPGIAAGTEIVSINGTTVQLSKAIETSSNVNGDTVTFTIPSEGGYFFPIVKQGERLAFRWETADPDNAFFFYTISQNVSPESDTTQPVLKKVDSIVVNYGDFTVGSILNKPGGLNLPPNTANDQAIKMPLQINIAFSPAEEKIYERKLACYLEKIASGSVTDVSSPEGLGNITLGLPVTQQYYSISTQALTGSGTGLLLDIFRNGTVYIINGISSPGQGYKVGDKIKVLGSLVGGSNVTHDITFTVNRVNESGVTESVKILEIDYYGEGEEEDERYRVWLENFGISFHVEDAQLLKNYDIKEGLPDWKMVNHARKQFLVNKDQVLPYVGTYKGLINFINLFDYDGDLQVKEFWKNINKSSPAADQFALVNITDMLDDGEIDNMQYASRGGSVVNSDQFQKTAFLALCYEFTKVSGEYDDDGIPEVIETTQFTPNEIFYKLYGLGKKLKREILPINVIIRDIIGEFLYFEKFNLRYWTDEVSVKTMTINHKFRSKVALPDKGIALANIRDIRPLFPSQYAIAAAPATQLQGFPKYSFNPGTVVPYANLQQYSPLHQAELLAAVETFYQEVKSEEWKNHGNFYYWAEGNVNIKEQIGCPVVLEVDLPLYIISDYDGITLEDLITENMQYRDLEKYLNLVDIEWIITKPAPNPYNWSYRGSIYDFDRIAHILPNTGSYTIQTIIYDQFAGNSVDFIKFEVEPTVASLVGIARTSDKFSYKIGELNNVSIGDFGDSTLFNPNITIPSFTQRINRIDLEKEIFDWKYYGDKFTGNPSPLDAKVLDPITNQYKELEDPTLTSEWVKYWGLGEKSFFLKVSDIAKAQIGELFHTKFYQLAYHSEFLQGFTIKETEIRNTDGSWNAFTISLGLNTPVTIPDFVPAFTEISSGLFVPGGKYTLQVYNYSDNFTNVGAGVSIAGTITCATNSTTVNGTNTQFLTQILPGDVISINNNLIGVVDSVTDNLTLILESNATSTILDGLAKRTREGDSFIAIGQVAASWTSGSFLRYNPAWTIDSITNYLNSSQSPVISDFTYRKIDSKIIGGFKSTNIIKNITGTPDSSFSIADSIYQSSTSGRGRGALFTVQNLAGSYSVTLIKGGFGYETDDTIEISGEELNGISPDNDLIFTVGSTVDSIYAVAKTGSDKNNYQVKITYV